jgi:limonene-1,2-epoxide hydrolase
VDAACVVEEFIRAIERHDLDAALELVTDDVVYDNVPMGAVHGPEGMRRTLEPFLAVTGATVWQIHRQVAGGDVVMNERTDRFELHDGRQIELAVAGVFVVRDGRIALWRDYFDLGSFRAQFEG